MGSGIRQRRSKQRSQPKQVSLIRLDHFQLKSLETGPGFEVMIEGFNLHGSISPPRITVGGIPLEQIEFQLHGRRISGVLPQTPPNRRLVMDYGFTRAEIGDVGSTNLPTIIWRWLRSVFSATFRRGI